MLVITAVIEELETRRGWLADRFDALEDIRLLQSCMQLSIVLITRKWSKIFPGTINVYLES